MAVCGHQCSHTWLSFTCLNSKKHARTPHKPPPVPGSRAGPCSSLLGRLAQGCGALLAQAGRGLWCWVLALGQSCHPEAEMDSGERRARCSFAVVLGSVPGAFPFGNPLSTTHLHMEVSAELSRKLSNQCNDYWGSGRRTLQNTDVVQLSRFSVEQNKACEAELSKIP